MNDLHSAALAYAIIGWPVFPLAPGSKVPLFANPHRKGSGARADCRGRRQCGRDGHGVLDATTDPAAIDTWWTRTPRANIGLACGITDAGEGPDVVDIDVKKGAPGLDSLERLRQAGHLIGCVAAAHTPTGGKHLFFEGTRQGNSTMPKWGVDFRSSGGYVVLAPSRIGHDLYAWTTTLRLHAGQAADWAAIRNHLQPPRPQRATDWTRPTRAPGDMSGLVDWVGHQGEGNRNSGLYWATMQALQHGGTAAVIDQLRWAAIAAGLDRHGIDKTIDSATRSALRGDR